MIRKLFLMCFFAAIGAYTQAQTTVLKQGDKISNIKLISTNGISYDFMAQKANKGYIVVFMTPSCDHCRAYESRVMALDKKYKAKGYPVVAIGPYGDYPNEYPLDALPAMKKLATEERFTFPYLSDAKFHFTSLFGIQITPTAVVLERQPNGFIIRYKGGIDDEPDIKKPAKRKFVEEAVNKLLK